MFDEALLAQAVDDPALRALVALTQDEFFGHSTTGGATAVVDGARTILRVEVEPFTKAALAGFALVEALNDAISKADEAVRQHLAADASLPAELRLGLEGGSLPSDTVVSAEAARRDYSGASAGGQVVVTVSGRDRRFISVYLARPDESLLAEVPAAANEAMASAELARDGATPLVAEMDAALERLDANLSVLDERLNSIDDQLSAINRELD